MDENYNAQFDAAEARDLLRDEELEFAETREGQAEAAELAYSRRVAALQEQPPGWRAF